MNDVIKRLRSLKRSRFDISTYIRNDDFEALQNDACGSAACVMGWFCIWYPRTWEYCGVLGCAFLGRETTTVAAAKWLGVTIDEANDLFLWSGYDKNPTPNGVARKMQKLVDDYKWRKRMRLKAVAAKPVSFIDPFKGLFFA